MTKFIDIGRSVKIRFEPYQILRCDLDQVELEMLAYRLRSGCHEGEIVPGTALKQIQFPSNTHGKWYIVYLVLAQTPTCEIFIVSISPRKFIIGESSEESDTINQKTFRIALALFRAVRVISGLVNS